MSIKKPRSITLLSSYSRTKGRQQQQQQQNPLVRKSPEITDPYKKHTQLVFFCNQHTPSSYNAYNRVGFYQAWYRESLDEHIERVSAYLNMVYLVVFLFWPAGCCVMERKCSNEIYNYKYGELIAHVYICL